jgi:hypothetical protein
MTIKSNLSNSSKTAGSFSSTFQQINSVFVKLFSLELILASSTADSIYSIQITCASDSFAKI